MFSKFPGIGPRQAKRFVYYLLSRHDNTVDELVRAIQDLKKGIVQCGECQRFYAKNGHAGHVCSICSDDTRDASILMVVPRDIDLDAVEKSGSFRGHYFVLGGVVPILEKEPEKRIRIKDLKTKLGKNKELKEIVLAMNANNDGENTADYLREELKDVGLEISILGRGLSTGAELEYADPTTLREAFIHRTK
jgi:recombination protein RecR